MYEKPVHECADCILNSSGRCPFVSKRVKAGQTMWMQGDVPREVVFIKEGLLSLSATEPSGVETLSTVRGPRSMVGAEALQSRPSSVSVEALTDMTVCACDAATVHRWLGPPTPAASLLQLTLEELGRNARDLNFRSGPSLARVARFLIEYSKLIDAGRQAPFSKQHVARLLGMRAETLSRCLRQLVDDSIIESGRHVRVLDNDKLLVVARGAA